MKRAEALRFSTTIRRLKNAQNFNLTVPKGVLPAWPQAGKEDPEHAVERTKPQPWSFPVQDRHLLAESDVFQL